MTALHDAVVASAQAYAETGESDDPQSLVLSLLMILDESSGEQAAELGRLWAVETLGPDGRCQSCRRGHYAMPDGSTTNYPCTTEGCACWYCGPPTSPAQVRDALNALLGNVWHDWSDEAVGAAGVVLARMGGLRPSAALPAASTEPLVDPVRKALAGLVAAWNDCTPPADMEQYLTPWIARAKHALSAGGPAASAPTDEPEAPGPVEPHARQRNAVNLPDCLCGDPAARHDLTSDDPPGGDYWPDPIERCEVEGCDCEWYHPAAAPEPEGSDHGGN